MKNIKAGDVLKPDIESVSMARPNKNISAIMVALEDSVGNAVLVKCVLSTGGSFTMTADTSKVILTDERVESLSQINTWARNYFYGVN